VLYYLNVYFVSSFYIQFNDNVMVVVMTSFGWKRKIGSQVSKIVSQKFKENAKEHDGSLVNDEVDWLTLAPKRHCLQLEDAVVKSARLRQEGITLAESERYFICFTMI